MPFAASLKDASGTPCPYCRTTMRLGKLRRNLPDEERRKRLKSRPTRDHVTPRCQGAGDGTIIVCAECNLHKGGRTLAEWHQMLVETGDPRAVNTGYLLEHDRWRNHTFTGTRASPPPLEFPDAPRHGTPA